MAVQSVQILIDGTNDSADGNYRFPACDTSKAIALEKATVEPDYEPDCASEIRRNRPDCASILDDFA